MKIETKLDVDSLIIGGITIYYLITMSNEAMKLFTIIKIPTSNWKSKSKWSQLRGIRE